MTPTMTQRLTFNVGTADRIVRALLGGAMLFAGLSGRGTLWSALGVIVLLTAAFSFCPIYAAAGLSTRRRAS